jgi:predicted flavoprotein YhiN
MGRYWGSPRPTSRPVSSPLTCTTSASAQSRHEHALNAIGSTVARCGASGHDDAGSVGIFGGGAAGLTAALFASTGSSASHSATSSSSAGSITLYEKTDSPGKKIKASGGTRCNILPNPAQPIDLDRDFHTHSKLGCLRALMSSWSLQECEQWLVHDIGIPLKLEEHSNKMFPASDSGAQVRDRLVAAIAETGAVRIVNNAHLVEIDRIEEDGIFQFRCRFADGSTVMHRSVVLATGGKSFPALGTTGEGYDILTDLGVEVYPPEPALTPLVFSQGKHDSLTALAGVSLQNALLTVSYPKGGNLTKRAETQKSTESQELKNDHENKTNQEKKRKKGKKEKLATKEAVRGQVLITHTGLSGPDPMDLSYWSNNKEYAYRICWDKELQTKDSVEEFLKSAQLSNPKKSIKSILSMTSLPASLVSFLLNTAGVDQSTNISSLKKTDRQSLIDLLVSYPLQFGGNEGFPKAEVSSGGVPLEKLDLATMGVRDIPGLYVIGELCDVHGRIGGFNFLLAWYTGRLAGLALANQE